MEHTHRLSQTARIQTTVEGHVWRCTQCSYTKTTREAPTATLDPLDGIPDDDRMLRFGDFARLMRA